MPPSDQTLAAILDALPESAFLMDPEGIILVANETLAQRFGRPQSELQGTNAYKLLDPDTAAARKAQVAEILRSRKPLQFEDERGGRIIANSLNPLLDDQGQVVQIAVFGADITERRLAERQLAASESRFRAIFNAINDAIVIHDPDTGRILDVNDRMCDMYGCRREEVLAEGFPEISAGQPPYSRAEALLQLRLARDQGPQTFEWLARTRDGRLFWVEVSLSLARINDLPRVLAVVRDISDRKAAERALIDSEERFRRLFEDSPQASLLLDEGRFIAANRAALTMLRLDSPAQIIGRTPTDFSPPLQPDGRSSAAKAAELIRLAYSQGSSIYDWEHQRADGEPFPVKVLVTVIRHQDKYLLHNVWHDITEQKQAHEQIAYLAHHDALTGLPNRVLGQDQLSHHLAAASRHHCGLAVLHLDLDKFKYVNDTYGHKIGDLLLKGVAQRLSQVLRAEDCLCRLSADEFMIVLVDLHGPHPVTQVAAACDRLLASLVTPFDLGRVQHYLSLAIGVAVYPQDGGDGDTLMRNADTALNAAKKTGQHGYRFFEPQMNAELTHFVQTRDALRTALERRELELHYQPQVELRTGRVVGIEALMRWRHLGQDLLMPGAFIGAAEESGLIVPIGRWVLEEACRQAAAWQDAGWRGLRVAVNLSAVQFRQPHLAEDVLSILAASGLPPDCLELELTESILLQSEGVVQDVVTAWKKQGIQLSIDDFGTGYSSLSYLKHFRVDKLKIDRSFVIDVLRDQEDRAIVQAMIQIARSLNLKTIAEGVEDTSLAEQLKIMGCDEAQGYLYAKPLPAAELEQWLQVRVAAGQSPGV